MSKNGYQSNISRSKYVYQSSNTNNLISNQSPYNLSQRNNYEEEPYYFSPITNEEHPGRIIHQTTKQSFDDLGNRVITTKTIREIDSYKNKNFDQQIKKFPKKSREKINKISKYINTRNEVQKQRELYSSPDFQSGSPYDSPIFINDLKNTDEYDEDGYQENYKYESKNINGKNIGKYIKKERYEYVNKNGSRIFGNSREGSPDTEIISPVGYNMNYSSGSDIEENQMKSFDNYKTSGINDKYIFNKIQKNRNLNYELEDPERFDYLGNNQINDRNIYNRDLKNIQYLNRSEYRRNINDDSYQSDRKDFQSPERNLNEDKRFRKVTVGMIDSKGPTNDDRKVTKIMTSKVVNVQGNKVYEEKMKKTKVYNNNIPNRTNLSRIQAAKIIQSWWRRRFTREEEVYDITVKKAIKLQSYIRGFLVRKKVLRYITLAIYYQSFCDKLQDVLCNHIKKVIFRFLKDKFFYKRGNITNPQRRPNDNLIININKNIQNNRNIIQKEMIISKTNRTTQQNSPRNINYQVFKTSTSKTTKINNIPSNYPSSNIRSPISYPSPITYTNQSQIDYRSPETYQSKQTDIKIYHISPDIYNQNKKNNRNLNKTYDNIIIDKDNTKYTNENKNYSNYYYSRVENIDNRERNISPTFGVLNQNKKIIRKVLTANNSNTNINRKKLYKTDSNVNIASTTTTTRKIKKIVTSPKSTKKPVKITTNKNKRINIKNTKLSKIPKRNIEIISGGTLSIIKLPNRKINNSESERVYTRIKEERTEKYEKYEKDKKKIRFKEPNQIDNQLSINIVKLPQEKDEIINKRNKNVREEYVKFIEKPVEIIKEKEKIIIQKEKKPETAEEGNDTQVFDMKVCKRVSMSIEASSETKEIIKDEIKEIEIFKKREREKNKEINKYKKDIQKEKLKNKINKLKNLLRIAEYWKNKYLKKKFNQFKKNCFSGPKTYEVEVGTDIQLTHQPKEQKELGIQYNIDKVDEGSQAVIEIEQKKIKNFEILKIFKNRPISFEKKIKKKEKPENRITKSKLNIISKIPKENRGQQSEPWETEISKTRNDINIIYTKPKTEENSAQCTKIENIIDENNQLEIIQNKPKLVDTEVQHEPELNYIDNEKLIVEIKGKKKKVSESVTQYEKPESKIIKNYPISIIGEPKKEIIKIETCDAQVNTFNEMVDQGVNAVIEEEPKPKNIEVQIRTVKRSLVKLEVPILKKLWLRKAFRTFRDNCSRPEYHKVIGREILRMALLKWRFIKGYGPDRYGNAYDRNGNLLYKTKPKVADAEIQQEFIVETEDQSTQYIPIENIISTLKQFEIGAAYKKKKEPEKVDQAVGDNIKVEEIIQKGTTISYKYKEKEKPENRIDKNQHLEIRRTEKNLVEEGTEMPVVENKIITLEKLNISSDEYKLKKKKLLREKELLIQMIYRKMMRDKLTLSDYLRQWLKQTLLLLQEEQFNLDKKRRTFASVSKNERFALIEEIKKMEMGTQIEKTENKIETMPNIKVLRIKETKDSEVSVNIPSQFDIEKMKLQNENKITYKSNKKPIILETHKENDMNILSQDYIFKEEVKKGIHHPMTEEGKRRVSEILIKYFQTRGVPISVLKKYFTIWARKANYLSCLDNAKIITEFCRRNLNKTINYKKWKKICEKLILRERTKIIKLSRKEDFKRNKIFDLIRLTRINAEYAKKRYLHYIILCWLAYTRNLNRKRAHVKALYENMLNTYMHMADDVFGNNQKDNPSVQDALFEAVESDKFQTKDLKDVPTADNYYLEKKDIKKIVTNIINVDNDKDNEPKEYITYKTYISNRPLKTSTSTGNVKEKIIKEKVVRVSPGERLQSRGRGRKFRTKVEKEILNKFYDDKQLYSSKKKEFEEEKEVEKEEEKEDNEGDFNENYGENKSISIKITTNKVTSNAGDSYNYNMIVNNDKDIDVDKNKNKNEMGLRKKRALFGLRFNKEDEKEMEDEK